ncbi:hypothetical protein T492DRAFT_9006 [Pavlovales sp. CCMP2436]|nr:hypothetical protein T492DRAFT_9006 [Pavlovales sp. CCMP2436]
MFETFGSVGWTAVPFFLAVIILGNFFAVNLFLGILLATFDDQESHQQAVLHSSTSPVSPFGLEGVRRNVSKKVSALKAHFLKRARGKEEEEGEEGKEGGGGKGGEVGAPAAEQGGAGARPVGPWAGLRSSRRRRSRSPRTSTLTTSTSGNN